MKVVLQTLFFCLLANHFGFAQGTWTKIGDMPEIRYAHTADEINGKVYITGGVNTEQGAYPTTMLVYEKATSTWTTIPLPGNSLRGQHTSCVVDSNLYIIGGGILLGGTVNSTDSMYMFQPSTGEWIAKNPMPTDRLTLACALLDGKIYVAGGLHCINGVPNYNGLKTFEVYDLATETWSALPDMPRYRWGLSIVAFEGKIYVFGGRGISIRHTAVDVYDPQDSSWTPVTYIPTPRYQLATCVVDSNIYTIDGWYSSGSGPIYDTVEVYNPITDLWTTGTSMPVSVAMLDGYTLDGKIYMYGGSYTTHPNFGISDIWEFTPPTPPSNIFQDNFDSCIVGQQLACQNPIEWTTWSNLPCDLTEDPYISNTYAYSGSNSVVIVQNNDLVRLHGSKTTGLWYSSFIFFIPTGKAGYFNTLSGFTPNPNEWAMECYFDAGGGGRLLNGTTVNFTWLENTWQQAMLVVNLDTHIAEFYLGTTNPLTQIATWDWTRGGTITNRIDASDFFGATVNDQMFMDDYYFGDVMPSIIPVELTSFTAIVKEGTVELNWSTATETNNSGFSIERKSANYKYTEIGFVPGFGTTTQPKSYSYTDSKISVGKYTYRLKQIDFDGSYEYSQVVEVEIDAPFEFSLEQNYPNPFNPNTVISYQLPVSGEVTLNVYDILGNNVATLVNEYKPAGRYEVEFNASALPSGVYFYQLRTGDYTAVKKMLLLK